MFLYISLILNKKNTKYENVKYDVFGLVAYNKLKNICT